MADLLAISSQIIDSGHADQPVNRVTNELSEIADGIAMVESFSHCVALDTDDGLVCFDASGVHTGEAVRAALGGWRPTKVSHLVYTHGHADHVGGSMFFADDLATPALQRWYSAIETRPAVAAAAARMDTIGKLDRQARREASEEQLDRYFGRVAS